MYGRHRANRGASSAAAFARRVLVLAAVTGCLSARRDSLSPPYDLLIINARVVDGTGNPWYYGDLATRGARIAAVGGGLRGAKARRVIDARGLVIAPGFIDMLGHSEIAILENPHARSKITQGITSEITGEVSSAWPIEPPDGSGDSAMVARPWTSLDGYFRHLERTGTAINLGTYVAAASVRRAVMGDASRQPTAGEMRRMEKLVDAAMRDGAMGFSTGLIYAPTTFFTTAELITLARRAAAFGGGYASHIRSESDSVLPAIRRRSALAARPARGPRSGISRSGRPGTGDGCRSWSRSSIRQGGRAWTSPPTSIPTSRAGRG